MSEAVELEEEVPEKVRVQGIRVINGSFVFVDIPDNIVLGEN